jgi:hypothetical protein
MITTNDLNLDLRTPRGQQIAVEAVQVGWRRHHRKNPIIRYRALACLGGMPIGYVLDAQDPRVPL